MVITRVLVPLQLSSYGVRGLAPAFVGRNKRSALRRMEADGTEIGHC